MTVRTSPKSSSTKKEPAKTLKLTASQALIKYLAAQKTELLDGSIEPLFGGCWSIFGRGNLTGLGEALHQAHNTLPTLCGHNEQGMAHAAIAYAKAHRGRRAMAVTTSIGPGATNLVTAAALAHSNRLPVLLLPGDIFASRFPDPVLQQLEWERSPLVTANSCLEPVSRYYDVIHRPEQLLHALPRAIHTLLDPVRRGPVTLCMPQDTQGEAYDYPIDFFAPRLHRLFRPAPDQRQLEIAVEALKQAKKPLIIAGGGVHYSGACQQLERFAHTLGIAVAETQAGKGALHHTAPSNLGSIGVMGTTAANALASEADVVLCIGTRLNDFITVSKTLFKNPSTQFIGLNTSSFDAHKLRSLPLICDAQVGLNALFEHLKHHSTSGAYLQRCEREKQQWQIVVEEATTSRPNNPITDAQALAIINEVSGNDGIVVAAGGGLPLWKAAHHDGYHLEHAYSCIGHEIAGGLGVKLAHPEREVYVVVEDDSYLMLHTELLTAQALGIKINIVLFDKQGFGCINRVQKGSESPEGSNLQHDKSDQSLPVDFAANARSYGCHALKVDTLQQLRDTLKANQAVSESCVTIIETEPSISTPGSTYWSIHDHDLQQLKNRRKH